MPTTIQISETTLELLKKLKQELNAPSYDEAIVEITTQRTAKKSMAGSLAKYYKNQSIKNILKDLQDERRKGDRF